LRDGPIEINAGQHRAPNVSVSNRINQRTVCFNDEDDAARRAIEA
jgi:hypothetical protein